jgi:hypothetical protein
LRLRHAKFVAQGFLIAVGAEERNFRNEHQREARPGKPAFQVHGNRSFALCWKSSNRKWTDDKQAPTSKLQRIFKHQ